MHKFTPLFKKFYKYALYFKIMDPNKIPQKQFSNLGEFLQNQNNFWAHFLKGNPFGEIRREKPHFIRFQAKNPNLEAELSERVTQERAKNTNYFSAMTYELLFVAYKEISELVYDDDPGVRSYRHPELYI